MLLEKCHDFSSLSSVKIYVYLLKEILKSKKEEEEEKMN